jgi:hypothetical protein
MPWIFLTVRREWSPADKCSAGVIRSLQSPDFWSADILEHAVPKVVITLDQSPKCCVVNILAEMTLQDRERTNVSIVNISLAHVLSQLQPSHGGNNKIGTIVTREIYYS